MLKVNYSVIIGFGYYLLYYYNKLKKGEKKSCNC